MKCEKEKSVKRNWIYGCLECNKKIYGCYKLWIWMNEMFLIIKLVVKFFKNFFVYIKFVVMFFFSNSMFKFDVCY